MSVAIDNKTAIKIASIIAETARPYECLRDAREHGVYVIPVRDEAIELCLPLASRFVHAIVKLPGVSRVEVEDLEQAASLGIIEGVDSFKPSMGVKIQTHLWMRMRLRVNQERALGHWVIMRPPKSLIEKYMSGQLSTKEQEAYLFKFVQPESIAGEESKPYGDANRNINYGGSW